MPSLLKSKSYKEFKDLNPNIGITKLGYDKLKNPIDAARKGPSTNSKNKTRKAMPQPNPRRSSVNFTTGATRGAGQEMISANDMQSFIMDQVGGGVGLEKVPATRTKGYMPSLLKSKSYKEFKNLNPDIRITKSGYDKLKNPTKKMGGGQVMKYKKGGIVYKQGGGVIKANSGGQGIVDSGYTKV